MDEALLSNLTNEDELKEKKAWVPPIIIQLEDLCVSSAPPLTDGDGIELGS